MTGVNDEKMTTVTLKSDFNLIIITLPYYHCVYENSGTEFISN